MVARNESCQPDIEQCSAERLILLHQGADTQDRIEPTLVIIGSRPRLAPGQSNTHRQPEAEGQLPALMRKAMLRTAALHPERRDRPARALPPDRRDPPC